MKKSLLILGLSLALFSCNKEEGPAPAGDSFKTAYVDIQRLNDSLQEVKDLKERMKVKENELGRGLDEEVKKFQLEAASFRNDAQLKGPEWAQMKGEQLQKKEQQLTMMQQSLAKQFQDELQSQNDSINKRLKEFIKGYGKEKGYDYIYATVDISSVLYAKEGYDITAKLQEELNDRYKSGKKDEPAKTPEKKK